MKPRYKKIVAIVTAALLCSQAQAQSANDAGIESRNVAETLYNTIDTNARGKVHMGEIEEFRASVFDGMDYDQNGAVNYQEFSAWDPGFALVADQEGRGDAYVTASKIVFAFWDRDGDGKLKAREMRFAMSADFRRADLDDDAFLTRDEFFHGFPIIVAMRAAIRPDL